MKDSLQWIIVIFLLFVSVVKIILLVESTANKSGLDGAINVLDIIDLINIIFGNTLLREEEFLKSTQATIEYGNGEFSYTANGDIAGIQIEVKGEYSITENKLPEGWKLKYSEGTILLFSIDGSSLDNNTLFKYTGDIEVESAIVADWHGSGIAVSMVQKPCEYVLDLAYPNPFNPVTTLSFALPIEAEVSLSIYNLQGREVGSLINGNMDAGYHSVVWNADSHSSGVYFVKMVAGNYVNTQKLMLVK